MAPVEDTADPVDEPVEPVAEAADPVEEPVAPVEDTADPVDEPVEPVAEAADPVDEPMIPVEDVADPAEEPAAPVDDMADTVDEPVEPVAEAADPIEEPVAPVEDAAGPAEEPAAPVEDTADPVEGPVAPVEDAAEPVEEPVVPVEDTTEPAEEPVAPVEDTADPADEPVEPVAEAAEPIDEPVAPAVDAAEPVEPPLVDMTQFVISEDYLGSVTFMYESAGFRNSLGMYRIAENGDIKDVEILFANSSSVDSGGNLVGGESAVDVQLIAGDHIGFFVIPDGFGMDQYGLLSADLDFVFRNEQGDVANVNTDTTLTLMSIIPGYGEYPVYSVFGTEIYHSAAQEENGFALNPDGYGHTVGWLDTTTGVVELGFEDFQGGGDQDFQDVVFRFDIGLSNAHVLDPNIAYDGAAGEGGQPAPVGPVESDGFAVANVSDWYNWLWGGGFEVTVDYTVQEEDIAGGSMSAWEIAPHYTGGGYVVSASIDGYGGTVTAGYNDDGLLVLTTVGQHDQLELAAGDTFSVTLGYNGSGFDANDFGFTIEDLDPADTVFSLASNAKSVDLDDAAVLETVAEVQLGLEAEVSATARAGFAPSEASAPMATDDDLGSDATLNDLLIASQTDATAPTMDTGGAVPGAENTALADAFVWSGLDSDQDDQAQLEVSHAL